MNHKIILSAVLVAAGVLSPTPRAGPIVLEESFLPPNDLSIPAGALEAKGITEPQFNQVLDQIQALYGPIIAARGGKLAINRLWSDATVNASAERNGRQYVINMYGGLARHEAITQDGLALVACHEIGHHLGGAPKFGIFERLDWASNEGQADYFANLKCLRLVFAFAGAAGFSRPAGDEAQPHAACAQSFASPAEQAVCVRAAVAGMSVTTLFRIIRNETALPRYDTPDPRVVVQMSDKHPPTQCRLDTYFSGSLCTRPIDDALDDSDPAPGACTRSQGYTVGLRPRCWYKPPSNEPGGESIHQGRVDGY
jgi:hypothetical protein